MNQDIKKYIIITIIVAFVILGIAIVAFMLSNSPETAQNNRDINRIPQSPTIALNAPTEVPIPETVSSDPADIDNVIQEGYRETNPDFYVANIVPYTGTNFTMDLDIDDTGALFFNASVLTTQEDAAAEINSWLQSEGLTQEQIETLNIIYR